MKINQKKYLIILVINILVGLFQVVVSTAKPIDLLGSLKGYLQGQDESTAPEGFVQFNQNYQASWKPYVTRRMNFFANMSYNNRWLKDLGTSEIINPSMRLGVNNDLFTFSLTGDIVERTEYNDRDQSIYSWNSRIASAWKYDLWPHLAFRIGQRFEELNKASSTSGRDDLYSYAGISATYDIYKFNLFYDFNVARSDRDVRTGTELTDITRHLVKLRYEDAFWSNRMTVNFSQLFQDSRTEVTTSDELSSIIVPVTATYSGNDITPETGTLSLNLALKDGNKNASTVKVEILQPVNLAIRTSFNTVEKLYVYTTRDDNLLVANTDAVTWDLYTSSDGFSWQLAGSNVKSSFNSSEFRFEIATGTIRAEYVKLVVTGWMPSVDLNITEIEAYNALSSGSGNDFEQEVRNYKTELYLGVIPMDRTQFNYSLSWSRSEVDAQENSVTDQILQSARINWDYSRYLSTSAGVNSVIEKNDRPGAIDTETRSYDLQFRSIPISTVEFTVGYNYNEYFEENDRIRSANNLSLVTTATWYPDLSTSLNLGYGKTQNDITGEESDSARIYFSLSAQLLKELSFLFDTQYNFSSTDSLIIVNPFDQNSGILQNQEDEGGLTSMNLNWRPSSFMSFGLNGTSRYGDNIDTRYTAALNSSFQVIRTSKTGLTFTYRVNLDSKEDTINNFGLVWGWDISKFFTLSTSGNYVLSDDLNSWNIYTQLISQF